MTIERFMEWVMVGIIVVAGIFITLGIDSLSNILS